jgi:FkbM family methyltransferase
MSGYYEAGEMSILPSLISQNDQVLEIGSAIGLLGLYCQKVLKVKRFLGCEPNPVTLGHLRQNYLLNKITPNIIQAAIAAKDGPVTFNVSEMFWADSLLTHSRNEAAKTITVDGLSLPSLLQRSGPGFNALLIDVEGAEEFISFDSLPDYVNKILIEIHPQFIGVRKAYAVLETLVRAGFKIHGHQDKCWGLIRD